MEARHRAIMREQIPHRRALPQIDALLGFSGDVFQDSEEEHAYSHGEQCIGKSHPPPATFPPADRKQNDKPASPEAGFHPYRSRVSGLSQNPIVYRLGLFY